MRSITAQVYRRYGVAWLGVLLVTFAVDCARLPAGRKATADVQNAEEPIPIPSWTFDAGG